MITTGIIKEINISSGNYTANKYKVEISIFKEPGDNNSKNYTFIANCCNANGLYASYNVGDKVYIDFINNDYSLPVIVGAIYQGVKTEPRSYAYLDTLEVKNNTILSNNTKIGDISYSDLRDLLLFKTNITEYIEQLKDENFKKESKFYDQLIRCMSNIPGGRYESACASYGQYIYLFGGKISSAENPEGSKIKKSIVRYDTKNDLFITLDLELPEQISGAAAATLGDYIYIFGGDLNDTTKTKRVLKFKPFDGVHNETVENLGELLPFADSGFITLTYDNSIYIIGGKSKDPSPVYIFNENSNTITQIDSISIGKISSTAAGIVDGNIYYLSSQDNNEATSIRKYNINTKEDIDTNCNIPIARKRTSGGVLYDKFYIFCGSENAKFANTIIKYDPKTNTITIMNSKLTPALIYPNISLVNNHFFIMGGYMDTLEKQVDPNNEIEYSSKISNKNYIYF